MINGLVEGFDLSKGAKQTPWIYKSAGRVLVPPMATESNVSWTTDKGYFYVADPSAQGIRYRLETRDAIHSQPAYWGKRSAAELRARTLVGALEALRHGITTIQDMNSLVPQDEETLDVILSAYAEAGIRVVFSIAVRGGSVTPAP